MKGKAMNAPQPDYALLTVKEAHDLCNLPIKALYRLIDREQVETRRIGRTIYIRRQSLLRWIDGDQEGNEWQNGAAEARAASTNVRPISSGSHRSR